MESSSRVVVTASQMGYDYLTEEEELKVEDQAMAFRKKRHHRDRLHVAEAAGFLDSADLYQRALSGHRAEEDEEDDDREDDDRDDEVSAKKKVSQFWSVGDRPST